MGNLTITTGALSAAAIKVQGTIDITNTDTSSITGIISDGASSAILTKTGSGTLTLSGTNTYSGSTTITNGVISISSSANLGATPGSPDTDNIIFNGGTLQTTADITLGTNKGITLTGNGTINADASTTLTYGGIIAGSGDLIKLGSGTLTLSGSSTFRGDVNINAGTLNLNSTGRLFNTGSWGSHGVVTVGSNATLQIYKFSSITGSLGYLSYDASNLIINGGSLEFTGTDGVMGDAASNGTDNKRAFTVGASGATLLNNTANTWSIWQDTGTAANNPVYNGDLTIHGSGNFSFNAVISGSINLTKTGSGTLLLSGNNTYTGQTNINAGIISITDNNSLGSADGATIVADGASLSISNNITSAENITISGTGISSNGAIRNTADDNTLTGLITLAADSEIQIDSGSSLTLNPTTGSAVTGAYNLTIDSVGTSTISDPIAISTGDLTKTGAGILTLGGTNSYTGSTTISAGTLYITNTNALGTTAGTTTISPGAQLTIATGLSIAEDINISGTGISSAGAINSAGSLTLSGDINTVATASIITTGDLIFSGNIVKTSGSDATLTISTAANLQFTNASSITATNNTLSLNLTSDSDSSGDEKITLGANITTNGGSVIVNSDTYLTKYIEIDTTGTSDGAVTFSGLIKGYIEDQNRIILTGGGGYYYYDVTEIDAFDPVSGTHGTATVTDTLSSGESVTLGDGTLGWNDSQYTWTPDHTGDVEYLVLGGGASGTRGVSGYYWGAGGGAGAVEEGSLSLTAATGYNAIVGSGGGTTGVNYTETGTSMYDSSSRTGFRTGFNGFDSSFASVTANGGLTSIAWLTPIINNIHAAAYGGTSGNGNAGGNLGNMAPGCGGGCQAGGGGGSSAAGSGLNGGVGTTSTITGASVEYGSGGAGLNSGTTFGSSSGGAGGADRAYGLANTGSGGSDGYGNEGEYVGNGGSGLVVIAFDNGLTINSGSARTNLTGNITQLSNLEITSSHSTNSTSGVISGLTPISYIGTTAGQLTISGNNTFTGNVNVVSGSLNITHNNALGSADGATIVADGASLSISNDITSAENITISGTGISSNGAIRNTADDNTLTGLITLAADSEIQIDSGSSLTLNPTEGNAITGTYNLTIESVGTSSINDPIAISTGDLTKTGAGTLTLGGTNTFTGDLTISAGTVTVSGTLHNDVDVLNSGTYDVDATDTINSLSGTGAVELNTGITLTTGDANNQTISGVISGAGNLTKVGNGILTLSNTNTYSGDTTISAGTIKLTGSVNALTDLTIASGATLDLTINPNLCHIRS